MIKSHTLAIAAALATGFAFSTAQAAPHIAAPVVLEAVVVTPTATYSASQWQARVAARSALAAVTLEPIIVTPSRTYTAAEWQQHEAGLAYAKREARHTGVRAWLNAVWKHFQFKRSPVQV